MSYRSTCIIKMKTIKWYRLVSYIHWPCNKFFNMNKTCHVTNILTQNENTIRTMKFPASTCKWFGFYDTYRQWRASHFSTSNQACSLFELWIRMMLSISGCCRSSAFHLHPEKVTHESAIAKLNLVHEHLNVMDILLVEDTWCYNVSCWSK